jgi:hypothetical protein
MASAAATPAVRAVRRASCSRSTTSCGSQPAGPRASTTCAPPARSATSEGRPCRATGWTLSSSALPSRSWRPPVTQSLVAWCARRDVNMLPPTIVIVGVGELVAALRAA